MLESLIFTKKTAPPPQKYPQNTIQATQSSPNTYFTINMLDPIENILKIKPQEREYEFNLYSFEERKDLTSNDFLEGQSIVFISERYETGGKYGHHIHFAACTNDLFKVESICDWTALSEKKANCLGVLLIDSDMNEGSVAPHY